MFGFFKKSPLAKKKREYEAKLTEAMKAQQSGNIQKYAELSDEANKLLEEIKEIEKGS